MMYLIQFDYEYYCQGWEDAVMIVLVRNATSFEDACKQILEKSVDFAHAREWTNPKNFVNLTI